MHFINYLSCANDNDVEVPFFIHLKRKRMNIGKRHVWVTKWMNETNILHIFEWMRNTHYYVSHTPWQLFRQSISCHSSGTSKCAAKYHNWWNGCATLFFLLDFFFLISRRGKWNGIVTEKSDFLHWCERFDSIQCTFTILFDYSILGIVNSHELCRKTKQHKKFEFGRKKVITILPKG